MPLIPPDWREVAADAARWARSLATSREHRRLRILLLVGIGIRLLLAPLTSWGIDTPFFTVSTVNLLYTGNLYAANTFYNPPLGPMLQLPLFRLAAFFQPPSSFVQFYPALVGVSERSQMLVPFLPTPGILFLLKLPYMLADLGVALLLYAVGRRAGERYAVFLAAVWFLNPVVIWASSVHGEVDSLAALLGLAFVLALWKGWNLPAGVFLGLGVFAKIYPIAFLPFALAWTISFPGRAVYSLRERLHASSLLLAGAALSVVPFIPYLPGFAVILAHQAGNVNYGGLSILIAFNPELSPISRVFPVGVGHSIALGYQASLAVAVVGSVILILRARRGAPLSEDARLTLLSTAAAWVLAGGLLALLSPQAENAVGLLPFLLLMLPVVRRWGPRLIATLSAAAWAQYLSLLTPFAFFYPLAVLLGPSAVGGVNGVVIAYSSGNSGITQGMLWFPLGVIAGAAILAVWGLGLLALVRSLRTPVVAP